MSGEVSAVNGTVPPNSTGAYLSVDAIMAYISVRVGNLDSTLTNTMAAQEARSNTAKQYSQYQATLGKFTAGIAAGKDADLGVHAAMANDIRAQFLATKDPALRSQLQDIFKAVTGRALDENTPKVVAADAPKDPNGIDRSGMAADGVSKEDFDTKFVQRAKDGASAASQGMDLEMVNIQSMISQRQQAMQLGTQMLATFNDTIAKVLGNIHT
jgi:hypothetical protein